jgi:hypothetical protein
MGLSFESPGFQRRERDGVVVFGGRDHLSAQGWWIFMALFGGGGAFLALDLLGPAGTALLIVAAVVLGFLGQLTGRFSLRLGSDGPVLGYHLLGVRYRRLALPRAVQARVMGLGDHGDTGSDGGNVAVELIVADAMLDELYIGGRDGSHALCSALQADLRACYGRAPERLDRLGANLPWLLRGLAWAQRSAGVMVPSVQRHGGVTTIDIPSDGLDADPREASLWVIIAGLALGALVPTSALGLALGTWISGAVLALAVGVLAWRVGRGVRIELGPEGAFLIRRRFGVSTWRLPVDPHGWSTRHAWWCGHPTGLAFSAPPGDDDGLALDRLKFGPACCASAWPWLPPPDELLGGREPEPSDSASAKGRRRRRRPQRR